MQKDYAIRTDHNDYTILRPRRTWEQRIERALLVGIGSLAVMNLIAQAWMAAI